MPFTFKETPIEGLQIIEPRVFGDDRGFFMETFKQKDFADHGIPTEFLQDNHSSSAKGVIRGLHYQLAPFAQGKLVRVVSGSAWDVAVDLREGSKTYGEWYGIELTSENHMMFWIPEGFAHGFAALSDDVQFLYKTTNIYDKASERAIRWDDPDLAIDWPVTDPIVSEKDQVNPTFREISESDRIL